MMAQVIDAVMEDGTAGMALVEVDVVQRQMVQRLCKYEVVACGHPGGDGPTALAGAMLPDAETL